MTAADTAATPRLFNFLDKSHQQLDLQLKALARLADHIAEDSLGADQRAELRQVVAWFNREARQHHLDEEQHIFPTLLASSDLHIVQTTQRLRQDHGWLEENWLEIQPSLEAAAGGYSWYDPATLREAVRVFEQLYMDHLVLEESIAYPEARARIDAATLEKAGAEMAQRRAVREAKSRKH